METPNIDISFSITTTTNDDNNNCTFSIEVDDSDNDNDNNGIMISPSIKDALLHNDNPSDCTETRYDIQTRNQFVRGKLLQNNINDKFPIIDYKSLRIISLLNKLNGINLMR